MVLLSEKAQQRLEGYLRLQQSQDPESESERAPIWPTTSSRISQGETPTHEAIDIPGNLGDPVYSPLGGKITDVKNDPDGYGVNVRILLDSGQEVILGHLSGVNVRPGQDVRRGQLVGAIGSTGRSTGPHLHFEVREPGPDRFTPGFTSTTTALDPSDFFGRSPAFPSGSAPMSTSWLRESGSAKVEMPAAEKWTPGISSRIPSGYSVLQQMLAEEPGAAEAQRDPDEVSIIGTPLGDVTLKPLPWMRIGAVGVGLILVVVAIGALVKDPVRRGIGVAKKVAPAVIGAANPVAGVVAGVAAS